MSQPIIQVRGISKKYRLGKIGMTSFRDEIGRLTDRLRGRHAAAKPSETEFWALRDINFDVQPGEVGFLAGAAAGCIAQNVYLYCATAGLATVVRGLIDRQRLANALGLSTTERITLAQTVGRPVAA